MVISSDKTLGFTIQVLGREVKSQEVCNWNDVYSFAACPGTQMYPDFSVQFFGMIQIDIYILMFDSAQA